MHPSHVCTFHISFIAKSTVSPVFVRQEARNLLFNAKGFLFNTFMLLFMTTLHFCPPLILVHHYLCCTFDDNKSRQSSVGLVCYNLNKHGPSIISVQDECLPTCLRRVAVRNPMLHLQCLLAAAAL